MVDSLRYEYDLAGRLTALIDGEGSRTGALSGAVCTYLAVSKLFIALSGAVCTYLAVCI